MFHFFLQCRLSRERPIYQSFSRNGERIEKERQPKRIKNETEKKLKRKKRVNGKRNEDVLIQK
jgi:hypothetical protein